MIRMANLAARHERVAADVERRVLDVLRSGRYVGGPVVEAFLGLAARSFGWAGAVGTNSGTDALAYAMRAMGVGPGDEVIVPAVTFFATAEAVYQVGATPIVADVRADLPLLDPTTLPIGPKTRLVVAVHLFGEHCALPSLPVPVLDDSAQCAGANPPVRTGIAAAVSFYPTKTLGAAGDGGMVLSDDPELLARVTRLTHHGMPENYVHERVSGHIGGNSRLDALQAAVLLGHLHDLVPRVALRRRHAARYDAELPGAVRRLPRSVGHPVHQYVVRADNRDALRAFLATRGVETALYYPRTTGDQPALRGPATPNASAYCETTLALPVHECLTEPDVTTVIEAVRAFYA